MKHYNDTVAVKLTDKHEYFVRRPKADWEKYAGVTSVLNELYDQSNLINWAAREASETIVKIIGSGVTVDSKQLISAGRNAHVELSEYGMLIGTQVHDAIHRYHMGDDLGPLDEVVLGCVHSYIEWYLASGYTILASEQTVCSLKHKYCGTLDRIYATEDDRYVLGDLKTSNVAWGVPNGIRTQYWSQVGAYSIAYAEEHGVKFAGTIIVNVPKDGGVHAVKRTLDIPERLWLADLNAYNMHREAEAA